MFRSIVVTADLHPDHPRSLAVAASLARAGDIPIEVVTAVSPDMTPEDRAILADRVEALQEVQATAVVLESAIRAPALLDFLERRPGALVVMDTRARGPVGAAVFGSISEFLLARVHLPVLLLGPNVAAQQGAPSTLLAMVDGSPGSDAVVDPVASWARSFGARSTWLVQVLGDSVPPIDVDDSAYLQRLATVLEGRGVHAHFDAVRGRDPVEEALDFADRFDRPAFVLASERWTDRRGLVFHSTARALTHESPHPVLVVPRSPAPFGAAMRLRPSGA